MPTFKPKYGSNGTFYDGDVLVTILECSFFWGGGFFFRESKFSAQRKDLRILFASHIPRGSMSSVRFRRGY